MPLRTLNSIPSVKGKRVLCRVDLNVPMKNGRVIDSTRITRLIPTLKNLLDRGARLIVMSHFGRPDGQFVRDLSLAPLADEVSNALGGKEVKFSLDCIGEHAERAVQSLQDGEILLLENLRFHKGEEENSESFSRALASLADIYVNDAFACSHRAHASIAGVAKHLPAFAGILMEEEIAALESILTHPTPPIAAVVGGSKVSSKLELLQNLVGKMSYLVIGGAMANTFLKAQNLPIGTSRFEAEMISTARDILSHARDKNCTILLPEDVVVARSLEAGSPCKIVPVAATPDDHMILDIGPHSLSKLLALLPSLKTLVWNGPLGAFEYRPFDNGSVSFARMLAYYTKTGSLKSIAGGGDVVAAVSAAAVADEFSYISTAGGAFLEWLEGKTLPGISVLSA